MTSLKVSFLLLAVVLLNTTPAPAMPHPKQAFSGDSDVIIKKNADGTVEVSDADEHPVSSGGITYRPAPPGTTHYADGVVVRRNPDGSVEVTDEDSVHPAMHSLGSAGGSTVRHHANSHSGTHKAVHHASQSKPATQVSWPKR